MPQFDKRDAGQDADLRVDVPWVPIGTHNDVVQKLSVVKDQQQPPFEGFSTVLPKAMMMTARPLTADG